MTEQILQQKNGRKKNDKMKSKQSTSVRISMKELPISSSTQNREAVGKNKHINDLLLFWSLSIDAWLATIKRVLETCYQRRRDQQKCVKSNELIRILCAHSIWKTKKMKQWCQLQTFPRIYERYQRLILEQINNHCLRNIWLIKIETQTQNLFTFCMAIHCRKKKTQKH